MVRDKPSTRDQLTLLTDRLERAGVYGLGGAGFPTATKLHAVAAQRGRPVVVVNAAEGEPLSQKDRYLLSARLDTVLDGAIAAADALKANEIVIAIDERHRQQAAVVLGSVKARQDLSGSRLAISVRTVPSGYVTGQETALISVLSGGAAKPKLTPPYPFEKGYRGRPTLVSNAETYSHIGRVAAGSYDGTRLLTVGGAVANPGLIEIDAATRMEHVAQTVGGLTEPVNGVLLGGYAGTWTRFEDVASIPLDERVLKEHRLTLGAGIIFFLGSSSSCPVAEVARVARWMADESAGQCGPCVNGLGAIAGALEELTLRGDRHASYGQIRRWGELVTKRGACAHPDGVARFVTTALTVFRSQFDDHARLGACNACARSAALPTPRRRDQRR